MLRFVCLPCSGIRTAVAKGLPDVSRLTCKVLAVVAAEGADLRPRDLRMLAKLIEKEKVVSATLSPPAPK